MVGAGVAGLTAAYLLQRAYDVTLYEAEPRLGGHADTHDVVTPDGRVLSIDSGFIVHNLSTYPATGLRALRRAHERLLPVPAEARRLTRIERSGRACAGREALPLGDHTVGRGHPEAPGRPGEGRGAPPGRSVTNCSGR